MTDSSSGSSDPPRNVSGNVSGNVPEAPSGDASGAPASQATERAPSIADQWAPGGRITVDGPFEPGSAAQTFLLGAFALIATFIIFQVIVSPVVLIGVLVLTDGPGAL